MTAEGIWCLLALTFALIALLALFTWYSYVKQGNGRAALAFSALGLSASIVMSFVLPMNGVSWTLFLTVWSVSMVYAWCGRKPATVRPKSSARPQ